MNCPNAHGRMTHVGKFVVCGECGKIEIRGESAPPQMELVTAGNPNLDTLANVLAISQRHFRTELSKVLFLDTEGSTLSPEGRSIEAERNHIVRHYTNPEVTIQQQYLDRGHLIEDLPGLVANELRNRSANDIIVDLTNGTKLMSGLLYAAASLLRINNLFFLFIPKENQKKTPNDLQPGDYSVDVVSPLSQLDSLGKSAYFELIYYREEVNRNVQALRIACQRSRYIQEDLERELSRAVEEYFTRSYTSCVAGLGKVAEALAGEGCRQIKVLSRGTLFRQIPMGFEDLVTRLRVELCDPLRGKKGENLNEYEMALNSLIASDKILDLIKVYRNEAVHPRPTMREQGEAKLCLDAVLLMVGCMAKVKP